MEKRKKFVINTPSVEGNRFMNLPKKSKEPQETKELRDHVFILCLVIIVMGLLLGVYANDNTELEKSNLEYEDIILYLDSNLTSTTRLYEIHSQINLNVNNNLCTQCRHKLRSDSEYVSLTNRIN